jgi:tripartite-type tricarboxylate transporter receptor subunit TctC
MMAASSAFAVRERNPALAFVKFNQGDCMQSVQMSWGVWGSLSLCISAAAFNEAAAQAFPSKPLRIVTAGAGGGSDFTSRQVAQAIAGPLGHAVVVDNRPSGVIPGDVVAKSPPDGYTMLVTSNTLWLTPLLRSGVPYDPVRDFAPISWTNTQPIVLVVHPALQVNNVKELIALAKSRPDFLNYSTGTTGTIGHLTGELFNIMAGTKLTRVPYKSGSAETADLVAGRVQLTFGSSASVLPQVRAGKLRAIAVASPQPSSLAPGVPTINASGLPGFETSGTITGIWAPAKTPPMVISRLNQEIVRYLKTPEAKERFLTQGAETNGSSPEEFAAAIKSDIARWGKIIKDLNLREE